MRYLCKCAKCCGKFVCKTTWYDHNKQRKRRTLASAYNPVGTSSRVRNNPQDVASSPPRDLDVNKPLEEEGPLDDTDRMAGSDLVSILYRSNLI